VIVDIEGARSRRGSFIDAGGARSGRGWLAVIGWVLLFALIVGGVAYGSYRYARTRAYFVVENGYVVAYQGVPGSFAGVRLSWPLASQLYPAQLLPTDFQSKLRSGVEFPLVDLEEMEELYRSKLSTDYISPQSTPTTTTTPAPTTP
jgi:hypothetical protein